MNDKNDTEEAEILVEVLQTCFLGLINKYSKYDSGLLTIVVYKHASFTYYHLCVKS